MSKGRNVAEYMLLNLTKWGQFYDSVGEVSFELSLSPEECQQAWDAGLRAFLQVNRGMSREEVYAVLNEIRLGKKG